MEVLYLPVLSHFQNGNDWTGSDGSLRYQIISGESLTAEVWHGPLCRELSQVEQTETFPMDEDGLSHLAAWLEQLLKPSSPRAVENPLGG